MVAANLSHSYSLGLFQQLAFVGFSLKGNPRQRLSQVLVGYAPLGKAVMGAGHH